MMHRGDLVCLASGQMTVLKNECGDAIVRDLAKLALQALDQERDAKLGRDISAVLREYGITSEYGVCAAFDDRLEAGVMIMNAIANHLREESKP